MSATVPPPRPSNVDGLAQQQVPRCCPSHADWPTLRDHLAGQFPTVDVTRADAEIDRALAAAKMFGLPKDEQLPTVILIVRHSLMLLTGQVTDNVRLDPETHAHRRSPA
jgi:hypothetical protein